MWEWSDFKARPINDWRIDRVPSNWQAFAGDRVGMAQTSRRGAVRTVRLDRELTIHHIHECGRPRT